MKGAEQNRFAKPTTKTMKVTVSRVKCVSQIQFCGPNYRPYLALGHLGTFEVRTNKNMLLQNIDSQLHFIKIVVYCPISI